MKSNSTWSCLGLFAFAIGITIVGAILQGWVLSILWRWFVVSTFGLPPIETVQAIGLSMTLSFLIKSSVDVKREDESTESWATRMMGLYIVGPFVALGLGYIVTLFL